MKPRPLALFIALTLFATLRIAVQIRAQKTQHQIITFDAGSNITNPTSINLGGVRSPGNRTEIWLETITKGVAAGLRWSVRWRSVPHSWLLPFHPGTDLAHPEGFLSPRP